MGKDIREVQDKKLDELYDVDVTDEGYLSAVNGTTKLMETEAKIGDMTDRFILDQKKFELEIAKFEYEKEKGEEDRKAENKNFWLKLGGTVLLGVGIGFDIFGKLVVLGQDEFCPNLITRTARDMLEKGIVRKDPTRFV